MFRTHHALAALAGAAVTLAVPAAALASKNQSSSRTGSATTAAVATCSGLATGQPFLSLIDPATYFLAPGGDFEAGPAWTLGSGSAVVNDNEPSYLVAASDSHALQLGSGASASSPQMCADSTMPSMRLFIRRLSGTGSVSVSTVIGSASSGFAVDLGKVNAGASWAPSAPLVVPQALLSTLTSATMQVSLRFTADRGSVFRIDDVFVDPFKRI